MPNEGESVKKIVEYLEKNLEKGYKIEGLKWALINQKYSKSDIDKAVDIISARTAKVGKEQKEKEVQQAVSVEVIKPLDVDKTFFKKLIGKFKK